MPTNIESFVETLKSEGVDAGRRAAQKIEAEAREQAQEIIAQAKRTAEGIIADAEAEAEKIQARMTSSLELATRDSILLLQEKLSQLLNALLAWEVEKNLSDEEILPNVMREVIQAYTKSATSPGASAEIHIPQDMHSRLVTGALRELTRALKNQNVQTEVKASLRKAGFEYKIEGSTVEVNADSVTALLAEMIDPELRRILDQAIIPQTS